MLAALEGEIEVDQNLSTGIRRIRKAHVVKRNPRMRAVESTASGRSHDRWALEEDLNQSQGDAAHSFVSRPHIDERAEAITGEHRVHQERHQFSSREHTCEDLLVAYTGHGHQAAVHDQERDQPHGLLSDEDAHRRPEQRRQRLVYRRTSLSSCANAFTVATPESASSAPHFVCARSSCARVAIRLTRRPMIAELSATNGRNASRTNVSFGWRTMMMVSAPIAITPWFTTTEEAKSRSLGLSSRPR